MTTHARAPLIVLALALATVAVAAPSNGGQPVVSPRGDRIAFLAERDGKRILFSVTSGDATRPYEVRPDGTHRREVREARKLAAHDAAYLDETPSWFPDGKSLALQSNRTGTMEVWVMSDDGSGARQVTGRSGT